MKKVATTMAILALLGAATPAMAGGWYLYSPYGQPTDQYGIGYRPLYDQPWHQDGVYDTAAKCDEARQAALNECVQQIMQWQRWADGDDPIWGDRMKKTGRDFLRLLPNPLIRACDGANAAVCMASDDPRLAR